MHDFPLNNWNIFSHKNLSLTWFNLPGEFLYTSFKFFSNFKAIFWSNAIALTSIQADQQVDKCVCLSKNIFIYWSFQTPTHTLQTTPYHHHCPWWGFYLHGHRHRRYLNCTKIPFSTLLPVFTSIYKTCTINSLKVSLKKCTPVKSDFLNSTQLCFCIHTTQKIFCFSKMYTTKTLCLKSKANGEYKMHYVQWSSWSSSSSKWKNRLKETSCQVSQLT